MSDPNQTVAFQGLPGAYSHMAATRLFPAMDVLPCAAFDDAFAAVREGKALYAVLPIENSVAGRVADIHHLMPDSGLHIIGEYFLKVNHHLLAPEGAKIEDIRIVRSHVHALGQCRRFIKAHGLKAIVHADTAGAAAELAERKAPGEAAIASELAGRIYGLSSLHANIEDENHNTTRFLIMAREAVQPREDVAAVTTFVFRVRNVPAALYKALGGFATNGINMTKLESYQVAGTFVAARFYADVEGRPDQPALARALDELRHFTHELLILGVYPAHPYRFAARQSLTPE
ncbi:prephenate dehydratase [Rhodospirillum rubrum]|uniref:prephenate dehydratase n=1 Tax=Rhodospirillum rubrum (strain ATCC 11170 / ATH 1.1.1 / DSM 467 / LMG 4362 / NCIMB 8255 / S1) TaxID=269796 RepID=Q2RPI8_RHORT|nr:prephenate dehydratase [Rhodospirillum rubrum]ABC23957.1 prephenate dehydratase [Rhodospirillum rubrum ATCC 11170]AEO49702.1 prephenate dehydratase [Rhodospirillum rubrum F11]MBK5955638.1 prephenate dehydratase [Rhodospirillum rubrum]QXG79900.1 prephenate dehydratase [Rhodospirillum rubrum]HAQ00982.1 prephenate dehydratase [Rhodospirillum rubrum]